MPSNYGDGTFTSEAFYCKRFIRFGLKGDLLTLSTM